MTKAEGSISSTSDDNSDSGLRPLIYLHIPKTAGTSLYSILAQHIGPERLSEPLLATRIDQAEARRLDRFDVISGHISRSDQIRWFPERRIMITIREPIDRCLSWIYFVRAVMPSRLGDEGNLLPIRDIVARNEWARRNLHNRMVRQLGGHALDEPTDLPDLLERAKQTLIQAFWVAEQESLADDLQVLGRMDPRLCDGVRMVRANITPNRVQVDEAHPELLAQLLEMNQYDLQLWQWAKQNRLLMSANNASGGNHPA